MGQHGFRAAGPDRPGQLDLPVRRPHRPLMLEVVLLLLRIARLRPDGQRPALEYDLGRVVVGTGRRDRDRKLVIRLVHVHRRRLDRLLRHQAKPSGWMQTSGRA